jgi:hypothetical protein
MKVLNYSVLISIILALSATCIFSQESRDGDANYQLWSNTAKPAARPPITAPIQYAYLMGYRGVGEVVPNTIRISGRVTTATGSPIRNATLVLYIGNPPFAGMVTYTGSLGTYVFEGLPADLTYTVIVSAKRYRFDPWSGQIVGTSDFDGMDFIARPQDF